MYWVSPYYTRATFQPVWPANLQHSLALMQDAVQGERNDELFYDQLIKLAPTAEQKNVITSIRDDERGHNRMFRDMYRDLTGHPVQAGTSETPPVVKNYLQGLEQAHQGELAAVEKYRSIWLGLPAGIYKDTVFGIILDELKHASKYNDLLSLNRSKQEAARNK